MPRSNQTKQLLAQSLQELMARPRWRKFLSTTLSITPMWAATPSITHFEDKYDLVNWYFQ